MRTDEFKRIMLDIGRSNDIRNMVTYVNTVIDDYEKYLIQIDLPLSDNTDDLKLPAERIPEFYSSKGLIFEYFILYYFEMFFLSPLKMKIESTGWWMANEKMKNIVTEVVISKHRKILDRYILSPDNLQKDMADYQTLQDLFTVIGKELIDDNFNSLIKA